MPLATGREDEREDLEVVEVARAAGAAGFDTEFATEGDGIRCTACSAGFPLRDAVLESVDPAIDTPSGALEVAVVSCTCPSCGTQGHVVLPRDAASDITPAAPSERDLAAGGDVSR